MPPGQKVYKPIPPRLPDGKPVLPDETTYNQAKNARVYKPSRRPGSGDRGWFINQVYPNANGIQVSLSAARNINIPASPNPSLEPLMYTPANMPPGYSCLEVVGIHLRRPGEGFTRHAFGFWDHCAGDGTYGWQYYNEMTTTFANKYIRVSCGYNNICEEFIVAQAYKSGNQWIGRLWNYNTPGFETVTSAFGTNCCGDYTGWSMFETYDFNEQNWCPDNFFSVVSSFGMYLWNGSTWTLMTTSMVSDFDYSQCIPGTWSWNPWPGGGSWRVWT